MQSYLFYDLETSGLNKCFDQVLQYAAIRTDLQFKEIARQEFLVQINNDVVPSAQALLTHHLSPKRCATGLTELSAVRKIHADLNTPGTISLGYNTLGFDDEFLRFSFYRNLLSPYTHQYANSCRRMDIYPLVLFYFLFKPEILKWPEIDNHPSLKLEHINKENHFASGQAHDALVDVSATVGLAKVLQQEQAQWQYLIQFFDKVVDKKRMQQLPVIMNIAGRPLRKGILIESIFGQRCGYSAPVLWLGEHQHYKHQVLLRLDLPELATTTADEAAIVESTWIVKKKFAEPGFLLPAQERFTKQISEKRKKIMADNIDWCLANPEIMKSICDYYLNYRYPSIENLDVCASLYQQGFWSQQEIYQCNQFHQLQEMEISAWLSEISSTRLYELAVRVVGRHFPKLLVDDNNELFQTHLANICQADETKRTRDFKNDIRISPQQVITEIEDLLSQDNHQRDKVLLLELKNHLKNKFSF